MSAITRIKTRRRRNAEAAMWHTRKERGQLTPFESAKFLVWSANPKNQRALREVERVWDALGEQLASQLSAQISPAARIRKYAVASGVAAALVGGGVWLSMQATVVETRAKKLEEYALPDRTLATLQPNSRLEYKMDDAKRRIDVPLGEVYFNVARDERRPFVVRVGEGSVTATGTRFAVRRRNDSPSVVVEEGKVNVKPSARDQSTSVTAGQQLTILPSGEVHLENVDAKSQLEWARTVKAFADQTVRQIADEFNRRNPVKIQIADERLGREVLGFGTFYLDDPERFLEVLQTKINVVVERPDPLTLRVSRGP